MVNIHQLDAIVEEAANPVVVLGLFSGAASAEFTLLGENMRTDGYSFVSTSSKDIAAKYIQSIFIRAIRICLNCFVK